MMTAVAVVVGIVFAAGGWFAPMAKRPDIAVAPAAVTAYLPFDMPSGSSPRKVFAHYVPWFPVSVENLPAERDYYTTQLINPTGENGKHAAYGGLLRDRPLGRAPISGANWKDVDVANEISQAKSIGLDGFAVDIVIPSQNTEILRLLNAAQAAGGFAIQITADMSGPLKDVSATDFATSFAPFLRSPSAQRLADGRVVLGAFYAEAKPVSWWRTVLDTLRTTHQLNVAFVPTFLDAGANMDAFAPISYGFSNWGTRNPVVVDPTNSVPNSPVDLVRRAHNLGRIWMQPIAYQDNRPRGGTYEESANGTTNRNYWTIAINEGAEWTNLITWNDYAETTAVAPSAKHGWDILDLNAYRIAAYKFGAPPVVRRDAIYVSHRTQPHAAFPTYPQTLLMRNTGPAPSRDTVEVESFALAPSTVVALIGANWHFCNVPAGSGVCTFPLSVGDVFVGLARNNVYHVIVQSPFKVTNTPYVQDLQYVVAGGLR